MEKILKQFTENETNGVVNELNVDTFNRLHLAIMEKYNCNQEEAERRLNSLQLNISCGEKIYTSRSVQISLLSAVNMGTRAFLGGVFVSLPAQVKSLVNWPGYEFIDEIVTHLNGQVTNSELTGNDVLYIGSDSSNVEGYRLISNAWQGGVLIPEENICLEFQPHDDNLCLGGIAAASIGIGFLFLQKSGINTYPLMESKGISLWRPDLPWVHTDAYGPPIQFLPKQLWIIGLGHLGQAYLWTLSHLLYESPSEVQFYLQDCDRIVQANISSGLLTDYSSIGKFKTRLCSRYLESRGFQTRLIERFADENLKCNREEEPKIVLCGFDNLLSRIKLKQSNFDYLIDCGLGGGLSSFDDIMIYSNPELSAYSFWEDRIKNDNKIMHPTVETILNKNFINTCGILAQDIAGKAISSSFIGGLAGTVVVSELLRGLNNGKRFPQISLQFRNLDNIKTSNVIDFKNELTSNGYITIQEK